MKNMEDTHRLEQLIADLITLRVDEPDLTIEGISKRLSEPDFRHETYEHLLTTLPGLEESLIDTACNELWWDSLQEGSPPFGSQQQEFHLSPATLQLAIEAYAPELAGRWEGRVPQSLRFALLKHHIRKGTVDVDELTVAVGVAKTSLRALFSRWKVCEYWTREGLPRDKRARALTLRTMFTDGLTDKAIQNLLARKETTGILAPRIAYERTHFNNLWGGHPPRKAYLLLQERMADPRNQREHLKNAQHWTSISSLIEYGCTQMKIGELLHVTHQAVNQFISRHPSLAEHYARKQREKKENKQENKQQHAGLMARLTTALTNYIASQTSTSANDPPDLWAHKVAAAQVIARKRNDPRNFTYEQFFTFYHAYQMASEQGVPLSLDEMAILHNIHFVTAGRFLRQAGLPTLARPNHKKRTVTSPQVKEALFRAIRTPLNNPDIAYFIDVEYYLPKSFYQAKNISRENAREIARIQRSPAPGDCQSLTYRLASQIYEAEALGFTRDETATLLDAHPLVIDYARRCRDTIEPDLVKALQVIFPDRKITRPYLTL